MDSVKAFTRSPDRFTPAHSGANSLDDYAVIVLNVPIDESTVFTTVWDEAKLRICADGGANRVRDLQTSLHDNQQISLPHVICGDFDSVRPEVLNFFKKQDVTIVHDEDQYSTDLMKALAQLERLAVTESPRKIDVALIGGLEGRVDQALSQLHQLHLSYQTKAEHIGDIYLLAQASIVMLLDRGKHRVSTPVSKGHLTKYAGLVPLTGPATLTTTGFEWNLERQPLEFGHFISTSNHIVNDAVEIETNEPIIFTLAMDLG